MINLAQWQGQIAEFGNAVESSIIRVEPNVGLIRTFVDGDIRMVLRNVDYIV